jgi:hypothetical protein
MIAPKENPRPWEGRGLPKCFDLAFPGWVHTTREKATVMRSSANSLARADPQEASHKKYPDDTPAQRAKRAEIQLRYQRNRKERGSAKMYVRFSDLEKIFKDRHGTQLLDNAIGRDCLFVMANHLALRNDPVRRILAWVQLWAPWHGDNETEALIEQVMRRPKKWRADPLAERLGLDYVNRTRLGITTIGATDCKKAKREGLRRKQQAAAAAQRRAKAGAKPRAMSEARLKPWLALGISESTYRRRKRGDSGDSGSSPPYPLGYNTNNGILSR